MCLSFKVSIKISLVILWFASNEILRITSENIHNDETSVGYPIYHKQHMDLRGILKENQHGLRQAGKSEGQNAMQHRSLRNQDASVWGSIHLEEELGSGWVPASFPNPKFDPDSCGISSVVRQDVDFTPLYFCDPDRVVSNRNFRRIAEALTNFTMAFSGAQDNDDPDVHPNQEPISRDKSRRSWRWLTRPWRWLTSQQDTSPLELKNSHESSFIGPLEASDSEAKYITQSSSTRELSINLRLTKLNDDISLHSEGYGASVDDIPQSSSGPQSLNKSGSPLDITVGIAIAKKIDVSDILREYSFYSFEDEVDTINDAVKCFARYLLNLWWRRDPVNGNHSDSMAENKEASQHRFNPTANGVLIFLSVEERACFVTAGSKLSYVLPWWRLENIVNGMKTNLRQKSYSDALLSAIDEIAAMLKSGPPTASERAHDFLTRFGFVIAFTSLTFFMALCGEYRERHVHLKSVENRSRLSEGEKEKVKLLQCEFKTTECPICLEPFNDSQDRTEINKCIEVDKYNIPLNGSDGLPLKMLRCGHIFDLSCWRSWVDSDYGNSDKCPVCRQDTAGSHNEFSESVHSSQNSQVSIDFPDDVESMVSTDELTIEYNSTDILSQRSRLLPFDFGIEFESNMQTPLHSYGSTWTSGSEDVNLVSSMRY